MSTFDSTATLGTGARAIEVAALLGDSVVDIKHCSDPRSGKVTRATWGFIALGASALIASTIAFGLSVSNAATNKGALEDWTRVQHRPAHAFRPHRLGSGYDVFAFGGLALGLGALTYALSRARSERRSPYYRIGTAAGVELAVEGAPAAAFPLVAPSGDDFVFNFGPGIEGELILGGATTPLAALAAAGRARPSLTVAGAFALPIPDQAKIRARTGKTTFMVSAVDKPRRSAAGGFAVFENRALAYFGGSLAAHLAIWGLLQQIPVEDSGGSIDLGSVEDTTTSLRSAENEVAPDPVVEDTDGGGADSKDKQAGTQAAMASGAMGNPDLTTAGKYHLKDQHVAPSLTRDEVMARATTEGWLGQIQAADQFTSLVKTGDISSGNDVDSYNGAMFGADGPGAGTWGMGRAGYSIGGGCFEEPCGTIGSGRYNTIGMGSLHGHGYGFGPGGGFNGPGHVQHLPNPFISKPTTTDGLDKAIIERYIKRHRAEISYCYEKELLSRPQLGGEITSDFFISPNGSVASSTAHGFDATVSSCVAGVIKTIAFPAPEAGSGGVSVKYPFTFRQTGT